MYQRRRIPLTRAPAQIRTRATLLRHQPHILEADGGDEAVEEEGDTAATMIRLTSLPDLAMIRDRGAVVEERTAAVGGEVGLVHRPR